MSKLFVDLFDTGIKELTSLDSSMATHFNLRYKFNKVNQAHSLGLPDTELAQPIKPRIIEKVQKIQPHTQIDIEYSDIEPVYADFELPAGSLDEFKTKFDTHIKKLKSIEFKIPTQLKEIYLDLVEKLENILNYIESVAVGLFAELVEYIGRFIQWLTGPTQRTAEDILIEIKDVNETVELVENVIKK